MSIKKHVYLAGPILGCNQFEANDWRQYVARELLTYNLIGISPLRCEPLVGEKYAANYPDPKFGTARAIGTKNLYDLRTCDLTLAYLPLPPKGRTQSYGTLLEIGAAHQAQKPVIIVSNDPYVIQHPVVVTFCGWMRPGVAGALDGWVGRLAGDVWG